MNITPTLSGELAQVDVNCVAGELDVPTASHIGVDTQLGYRI